MEWYWFTPVIWIVCGFIALLMNIRDHPAMQENVGLAELWPVILGPLWLFVKVWQWGIVGRTT